MEEEGQSPLLGAASIARSPEFSRWTLDPLDDIGLIDLILQGARFYTDPKTGKTMAEVNPKRERLNDYGRREVRTALHFLVHKGIILSNLGEQEISNHAQTIHLILVDALLSEWRLIGVPNPQEARKLAYYIAFDIFAALKRAKDGKTWENLNKLHVVQEKVEGAGDKGGGMFSIFSGGK